MNTRDIDFLKLEEELLDTRKKLNNLIQEYHTGTQAAGGQPSQVPENNALYQDKIRFLEAEMLHLHNQLQILKQINSEEEKRKLQGEALRAQKIQNGQAIPMPQVSQQIPVRQNQLPPQNIPVQPNQQPLQNMPVQPNQQALQNTSMLQNQQVQQRPQPVPQKTSGRPQEYEKMFGKNFMGIFASVLVFISLIIFATLVLPYLSDTIKLIGLFVLSFGILGIGLYLHHKNKNNAFYIVVIACGIGSLYLTLFLGNLYFKMIGDIALYCFILVWAFIVKYLTRIKNLVFQIIGQIGIFIATILGTILCASSGDEKKFFVLTIFYLVSSCVFSEIDKAYLKYMTHSHKKAKSEQLSVEPPYYEPRFLSHFCKTLNITIFLIGFLYMEITGFKIASILLFMLYLLLEFYFTFRETCRHGFAFQFMTVANTLIIIGFFYQLRLMPVEYSSIFTYLAGIAVLFYAEIKNAKFKTYTLIWSAFLVFWGCYFNSWTCQHLYVYLTVIPFLLYGKWKNRSMYLNTGLVYLFGLWIAILPRYNYNGYRGIECFIMIAAVCAAVLYICRKTEHVGYKISGYILLCLVIVFFVNSLAVTLLRVYYPMHIHEMDYFRFRAYLITFFTISLIHLLLSKLNYFGTKEAVKWTMYSINAILMVLGCIFMHIMPWQIPTILITVLLFLINSKALLSIDKLMGSYVAFKYTILMVCILAAFHVENYIISICLLLFAIVSIVVGFYKNNTSFRIYGLILSILSIIKLILIDIHYDSPLQSALSFFVCGILCFIISFIYHKIDSGFKKKEKSDA